jgi:hypothetical protein
MVVSWFAGARGGARTSIVLLTSFCVACSGESCRVGQSASSAPAVVERPVPLDARLDLPVAATTEPTADEVAATIDALAASMPPERYDIEALARTLGPTVTALFTFVRDRIRYEAYSGVLRDAHGTLAARAGNSLDRARLLARLLQTHKVPVRFAAGQLPAEQSRALFGHMFDGFRPPPVVANPSAPSSAATSPFLTRVLTRARRDYPVLLTAVGANLATGAGAEARAQALRDISRHVWVQAYVDGQWQDLDASFPDAQPGESRCAALQTVDTMPDDWFQRVNIRLLAERLEGGVLKATPVLSVTRRAVDIVGREVFLLHVPPQASRGPGIMAPAARSDQWTPVIVLGQEIAAGPPIDFSDERSSTGFADALGGGSSDDGSAFVAEWLELEVLRPDGRTDLTRRTLIDRGSAAWRARAPLQAATLLPLDRDAGGLFRPRSIHQVLVSAGPHNLRDYLAVVDQATFGGDDVVGASAPLVNQLLPIAAQNFSALVWTDHSIVPAVNDLPDVRLYSDSPRILIVSMIPGDGTVTEEYDLRRDWLFGVSREPTGDSLIAERKLLYGALEGALEHEAVAQDVAVHEGNAAAVQSTSALLSSRGVLTLTRRDLDRLDSIANLDTRARLRAALMSDDVSLLVIPRTGLGDAADGWWEIASTGNARAVLTGDLNGGTGSWHNSSGAPKPTHPNRRPLQRASKDTGLDYTAILLLVAMASIVVLGLVGIWYTWPLRSANKQLESIQSAPPPPSP